MIRYSSILSVLIVLFNYNPLWANIEQRLSKLEHEMQDVCVQNAAGTTGALFASDVVDRTQEWFVDAEVLLWHAKGGDVDWAILYNQVTYPCKGSMKTLGFGWDWGVRVGLGKHFTHDGWDLAALYTYFGTQDSSNLNIGFQTAAATGGSGSSPSPFGTAYGSFSAKFNYNAIDLGLGRNYFVSHALMVHPHIGLKTLWLNQKYKLYTSSFVNASNTTLAIAGTINTQLKQRSDVWGIGPHVGLDGAWNMGCGVELISAVEAALLQSYFKVTEIQNIFVGPIGSAAINTTLDLKGPMHQFMPYGRLKLGLGWNSSVNGKSPHLHLSLAYEANYFWRVDQTIDTVNIAPSTPTFDSTESVKVNIRRTSEDIAFYGVTAQIRLDF